jgi:FKBP-type peptidyl-prolyl cis-trans isomerase 2
MVLPPDFSFSKRFIPANVYTGYQGQKKRREIMGKTKKSKEKSVTKEKSTYSKNKTLMIAGGIIVIVAVVAVAAYFLLMPGTSGSKGSESVITGTGSGPVAAVGDSVSVFYTGMFINGSVFDSNVNGTPITFTVGSHQVIPGFENAFVGMKAGQTKTVHIPVDQAYGHYKPEYIHVINRSGSLATMELTKGTMLTYRNPATNTMSMVKILNFTPDTVTVDGNSPLAGEPLTFTIQLVSVN